MPEPDQEQMPPCPFCGARAVTKDGYPKAMVRCSECGARVLAITLAQAIEQWSRRAAAAYTRFVNEPQNEAGETAAEPEDIIYALRARLAQYEAAAGIGQAEFIERLFAHVSELQISTSYSGHWINGYGHAREDVLRLIRKLESTAAEPWRIERVRQAESSAAPSAVKGEDEKCADHCGHDAKFMTDGRCVAYIGGDRKGFDLMCSHRCDFSRPARLGCATHGFKFRDDCEACDSAGAEPQTDSPAAQPESWYQDSTERMI